MSTPNGRFVIVTTSHRGVFGDGYGDGYIYAEI